MARTKVDKNSPEYLERKVSTGRATLLMILLFTLVNLVFLMADFGTYFLFSASVPYYLTVFCLLMEGWNPAGPMVLAALVVSAVILAVYLMCWILSKKGSGWMITATVLFILDTVALIPASFLLLEKPMGNMMDLVFHIWAIVELIQAAVSARKLKTLEQQQMDVPANLHYTNPENF